MRFRRAYETPKTKLMARRACMQLSAVINEEKKMADSYTQRAQRAALFNLIESMGEADLAETSALVFGWSVLTSNQQEKLLDKLVELMEEGRKDAHEAGK